MSDVQFQDPAWAAIMADERLAGARRKLSFHEIRLIVDHASKPTAARHIELRTALEDAINIIADFDEYQANVLDLPRLRAVLAQTEA